MNQATFRSVNVKIRESELTQLSLVSLELAQANLLRTPKCRRIHLGSREFTVNALRGRQVHSGSRRFTRASLGAVGFIRDRVDLLWHVMVLSASLGFECVNLGALSGRGVHSGLRGFTRARLGVVCFIRFRMG